MSLVVEAKSAPTVEHAKYELQGIVFSLRWDIEGVSATVEMSREALQELISRAMLAQMADD